ncbi:glycosyltransferase family 2 protein [Cohnella soli]|uniref:Glycosyltransferase family 2 protein n=1 Tax=Cohnella soli TaxID=425005 RepID=A0ABW0HMW3_9BACL
MIKVSVIMPVFNVESYLRECLDSLVSQTLTEIEVICINDCSTDRSLEILNEYATKDNRIIIINNKENIGAAKSRNIGLLEAKGEYLAILDSDDFCDIRMLEIAYGRCVEENADLGTYDYAKFNHSTKSTMDLSMPLHFAKRISNRTFSFDQMSDYVFQLINCAPWNKLYKRSFVLESGLEYQDLQNSNDTYFGYMILTKAKRIIYIETDTPLYYYRFNLPNQITSNVHRNPKCVLEALVAIQKSLIEQGAFEKYKRSFHSCAVEHFYYMFDKSKDDSKSELYELVRHEGLKALNMMHCQESDFISKYEFRRYQYFLKEQYEVSQLGSLMRINELFDCLKSAGYHYGLWGYGLFGKAFFQACQEHGFELRCIIDEDAGKAGLQVAGLTVEPFEKARDKVSAVIVPNSQYSKSIHRVLRQSDREIKLFDVDSYLRLGLKMEDCIY